MLSKSGSTLCPSGSVATTIATYRTTRAAPTVVAFLVGRSRAPSRNPTVRRRSAEADPAVRAAETGGVDRQERDDHHKDHRPLPALKPADPDHRRGHVPGGEELLFDVPERNCVL